ncbi:MAG: chemotaxis protein CheW [Spirochaetaceae bacterium]|jgi:purine-binding chemotaxis protein CheW|nr:chemotaxis protein CheW [Spirochaetaceae bacterium]
MAEEYGAGTVKYLIFTVREKRYAVPSNLIGEVTVLDKVFPLPLVPAYVRGIINRYSVPYALVDIGFFLMKSPSLSAKVLVLKEEVDKLAFLIDDVTDFADIAPAEILKIDAEETDADVISGSFEWKDGLVFRLEVRELINRIAQDFTR